jgi:hypothetical protein
MEILAYNHGPDFSEDFAPESYMAIGALILMEVAARDAAVMRNFSRTGPSHGGFDFDTYVEDCKNFDKVANRNAMVLQEANRTF